jgi:hypothetical protein
MYTTTTLVLYGLRPYSIINLIVSAKAIINLIIAAATSLLFTIRSIVHHTFPLLPEVQLVSQLPFPLYAQVRCTSVYNTRYNLL